MRLLFVCPFYPLPLDTGSRVRWFNLARQLALQGHTVDVLCFASTEEEARGRMTDPPFSRIEVVRTGTDKAAASLPDKVIRALHVGLARLRGLPQFMAYTFHPEFRRRLTALAPTYDTIFIETFFMAPNLDNALLRSRPENILLVEHDISYIPYQRHLEVARRSKGLFARLLALWNFRGIRAAEKKTLTRFHRVVVMSRVDATQLAQLVPQANILVVPNGVDTRAFPPRDSERPRTRPELLYVGGLQHRPNRDAIRHFLEDILPVLKQSIPDVHLTVLGATDEQSGQLAALASDDVTFAGWVPDASPYYDRCLALAVPLRSGGGTRLKILEAMAAGLPVITTTIGAEGLDLTPDENVLLADTPEEFARAVDLLLNDPAQTRQLTKAARAFCENRYDWRSIASNLLTQLDQTSRMRS